MISPLPAKLLRLNPSLLNPSLLSPSLLSLSPSLLSLSPSLLSLNPSLLVLFSPRCYTIVLIRTRKPRRAPTCKKS